MQFVKIISIILILGSIFFSPISRANAFVVINLLDDNSETLQDRCIACQQAFEHERFLWKKSEIQQDLYDLTLKTDHACNVFSITKEQVFWYQLVNIFTILVILMIIFLFMKVFFFKNKN